MITLVPSQEVCFITSFDRSRVVYSFDKSRAVYSSDRSRAIVLLFAQRQVSYRRFECVVIPLRSSI